jgi:hypothetical protein
VMDAAFTSSDRAVIAAVSTCKVHYKCQNTVRLGNVPADLLSPEPERFFWRKEVLHLTPLPPSLAPVAEGLPDL